MEATSCSIQSAVTTIKVKLSRDESHIVADITSLLNASPDVDNPKVNERPVIYRVRKATFDPLSYELQACRSDNHIAAGKQVILEIYVTAFPLFPTIIIH